MLGAGLGDDQHAAVELQHVDVVSVQLAQDIGTHDLLGRPAGGAPGGHVDDPVHHRQQRVHLVSRKQDRHLVPAATLDGAVRRSPARSAGPGLPAARPEEQPRTADEGVCDEHTLLLTAREAPDAAVGEAAPRRRRAASRRRGRRCSWCAARIPKRWPSRPRATRSRARIGMSGSSTTFWGT